MTASNTGRLFVLEAAMEYKQLSLSPEDQQLLESRRYGVEEVCRWFDVPPVLVHHSNVTTWGSGIDSILDGWYKLSINPLITSIEQAIRKQVLTPAQRARMHVEFSLDALLRGNLKDRMGIYATGKQNAIYTTNEVRQFENLPPVEDGDALTLQSNLVTLGRMVNPPLTPPTALPVEAPPSPGEQ
jgi:HK97 family phage portal protein